MIRSFFRLAGRLALLLATIAFLTAVSLFVIASWILTWPILRLSPRDKKIRATADFATSAMTLLTAFSDDKIKAMVEESLTEPPGDDGDSVDDSIDADISISPDGETVLIDGRLYVRNVSES